MEDASARHFVLIHGAGSGAWSWYKVAMVLKLAGHLVTALDMGGCGVNPTRLDELGTIDDYIRPLVEFMASLAEGERVVLVGHSYGGISISLAMDRFPGKIAVAMFVSAFMPAMGTPPVNVVKEFFKGSELEFNERVKFKDNISSERKDDFMANKVYQNCPPDVLELVRHLGRPISRMFVEDLANESLISDSADKYGAVHRVFVVCGDDRTFETKFQRWMVEMNPPTEVKLIEGADHMVMLSKPRELSLCLMEIATKYH